MNCHTTWVAVWYAIVGLYKCTHPQNTSSRTSIFFINNLPKNFWKIFLIFFGELPVRTNYIRNSLEDSVGNPKENHKQVRGGVYQEELDFFSWKCSIKFSGKKSSRNPWSKQELYTILLKIGASSSNIQVESL